MREEALLEVEDKAGTDIRRCFLTLLMGVLREHRPPTPTPGPWHALCPCWGLSCSTHGPLLIGLMPGLGMCFRKTSPSFPQPVAPRGDLRGYFCDEELTFGEHSAEEEALA